MAPGASGTGEASGHNRSSKVPFQIVRFAIVGGVGTLVNLATLFVAVDLLHIDPLPAVVIAFAVAVTHNFLWDKSWTFRQWDWRPLTVGHQYVRFVGFSMGGLGVNLAVIWLLVLQWHWWIYPSQVIAILVAFAMNFGLNKWLNFEPFHLEEE